MLSLGLVFPVFSGIQIDLNAVTRPMPDGTMQSASLCDHNCTEEVGGYTCPAAFTLVRGYKPKFAPGEELLLRIEMGRNGLMLARNEFLERHFDTYCRAFAIPPDVRAILAESLGSDLCEVNLFGGNPEMHPEVIWLIRELKKRNFRVNLTTTGRRFLTDEKEFVPGFIANPPHLLALSADDFDPERLAELFEMPLPQLVQVWKSVDKRHGQEQKFIEGIYAARLVKERGVKTLVLFNMVLHRMNLRHVRRIMDAIGEYLPDSLVNPYPAQDSFEGGNGELFSAADLAVLGRAVKFFIAETLKGNRNLTKRIHYWIVMDSVLERFWEYPNLASKLVAGHDIWRCYRNDVVPGAGMYLQIGKGNPSIVQIASREADAGPGGHAGCYWNSQTVTAPRKVHTAAQVNAHLMGGMQQLAAQSSSPCPGCSMPRLWFNMVTTELGLSPELRRSYLALRRLLVGF
jgi:organic radical activating enzyme